MWKSRLWFGRVLGVSLAVALLLPWNAEASAVKLSGRIRAADGAALAGHVEVTSGTGHVRAQSYWTDSEGRFSIEAPAQPRLVVVAKADGHISAEREVAPASGEAEIRLDFTLLAAGSVSGRVTDESGRPVTGAQVRLHYPGEVRRVVYEQEAGNVRSDDFGHFQLPFVAQGRAFVIEAASEDRLPGFSAPLRLSGAALEGVAVRLAQTGQRVRARVVGPGGTPVPGAMVRLQALAEAEAFTAEQRQSRTFWEAANRLAPTGADGTVEFRGVPAGRVTVVAGRPGGKLIKQEALVERGRTLELVIAVP